MSESDEDQTTDARAAAAGRGTITPRQADVLAFLTVQSADTAAVARETRCNTIPVAASTLLALFVRGLVDRTEVRARRHVYSVTPAGREALNAFFAHQAADRRRTAPASPPPAPVSARVGTPPADPIAAAGAAHVVIVDDERVLRTLYELILANAGYRVATAPDMVAGLALCTRVKPSVIIIDIFLSGPRSPSGRTAPSGLELIRTVRQQPDPPKIIAITGGGSLENFDILLSAKIAGADLTLRKPIPSHALLDAVAELTGGRSPDAAGDVPTC
jgi:CheY-like chemotaxis protein